MALFMLCIVTYLFIVASLCLQPCPSPENSAHPVSSTPHYPHPGVDANVHPSDGPSSDSGAHLYFSTGVLPQ